MTGWQPASRVKTSRWGKVYAPPNEERCNPVHPHTPGCNIILPKNRANMLVEERPTKRLNLTKGTFFDLLPMDVLDDINNWFIGLEYQD